MQQNQSLEITKVALDAMGGDYAPAEPVKGAVDAVNARSDIKVLLIGQEDVVRKELEKYTYPAEQIEVIHAEEVIETAEPPVNAIRKKKQSSIVVGMNMVKQKEADAFVSAGSSGAILVGGQVIVGRIKGIERPPLAPLIPTEQGVSLLVDCGANVDARPSHLVQFAKMGSIYMEHVMGIKKPRVAIVNIGAEEEKGNALVKETFPLLKECEDMDKYRLYGELITSNLYRIPNKNVDKVELENYYDNNAKITINLDKRFLPSINAKRFFKKYSKLKNALIIVSEQKADTLKELDYIESVVYELESCSTIEEVAAIYEEISENDIFKEKTSSKLSKKNSKVKKSKLTKNKTVSFNPIKYTIDGYTVFVGRNNKENDYLTLKFANKNDIWFHTKDFHGSHTILKIDNSLPYPSNDILVKVAELAAKHSKACNSSNVPVDYCEVKFVKKPSGSKPGMVIYTNNKTINVTP